MPLGLFLFLGLDLSSSSSSQSTIVVTLAKQDMVVIRSGLGNFSLVGVNNGRKSWENEKAVKK